jgi:Ca-activated chloride channel family protein
VASATEATERPSAASAGESELPDAEAAGDATLAIASDSAPIGSGSWLSAATPTSHVLDRGATDVAVWVDVPKGGTAGRLPTAVTLSIDTSGSMAGSKILQAQRAAQSLVDGLADGDRVSLHAFDDAATVRLAPTVLDALTRDQVRGVVQGLQARGATNIADALHIGMASTAQALGTHPVRRLVIISDGQATVGTSHPATLGRIAASGVPRGVQITALGVGMDYDERTLNELAVKTSGRMFHIGDPRELPSILERELALLQDTRATEAIVELVPARGVRITSVRGGDAPVGTSTGTGAVQVALGTLFGGQTRELVVRVHLEGAEHGERPLIATRLLFRDPHDEGLQRVQETIVRATVTRDQQLLPTKQHPRAASIVATLHAADLAQLASAHAGRGDFDAAERELARAEQELRRSASRTSDASERRRISLQAKRLGSARDSVRSAAQAPPAAQAAKRRASQLDLNEAAMKMSGY